MVNQVKLVSEYPCLISQIGKLVSIVNQVKLESEYPRLIRSNW